MKTTTEYMKEFLSAQEIREFDDSSLLCETPEDIRNDIVDFIIYHIYSKYNISNQEIALYKWDEYKDYLEKLLSKGEV